MAPLTAGGVLAIWEAGQKRSAVERALLLVTAATPGLSADEAAVMPIGERDRRLLDLREDTLGPSMGAMASCPECGSALDFELTVADLRTAAGMNVDPCVESSGWKVSFRLPDSTDLIMLENEPDRSRLRRRLVLRSLTTVSFQGKSSALDRLPDDLIDAVSDRMAACDPQGDVRLNLLCPVCEHSWLAVFDIASYLWAELAALAGRLLRDVHTLASAYGWREEDVLAIPARRRRAYLEMVAG